MHFKCFFFFWKNNYRDCKIVFFFSSWCEIEKNLAWWRDFKGGWGGRGWGSLINLHSVRSLYKLSIDIACNQTLLEPYFLCITETQVLAEQNKAISRNAWKILLFSKSQDVNSLFQLYANCKRANIHFWLIDRPCLYSKLVSWIC